MKNGITDTRAISNAPRSMNLASAIINIAGAALTAGGFVPLVVLVGTAVAKGKARPELIIGISLYGGCALYRFVLSAVSSFISMRKTEHALIPLADAGTFFLPVGIFMPFILASLAGPWRWVLLGALSAYAIGGFTLYLTIIGIFRKYAIAFGYALFFLVLPLTAPVRALMNPEATMWFASAGILYALALLFRGRNTFLFGESLWHAFVTGGVVLQYFGILTLIP